MKATGIVRKLDSLGRVVLPIELRRILEIKDHDSLEVFVEEDMIVLRKYSPSCAFCGESKGVQQFKGKNICRKCGDEFVQEIVNGVRR